MTMLKIILRVDHAQIATQTDLLHWHWWHFLLELLKNH